MKQSVYEITENLQLTENIFRMKLKGDVSAVTAPGQFIDIRLNDYYLRRPISVCDVENGEIIIVYKTVGHGTEVMSQLPVGEKLDILTGLGNGYDMNRSGEHPLLIGGGVGVPPLYMLAKKLKEQHKEVSVILGFNTAKEVFYETEIVSDQHQPVIVDVAVQYGVFVLIECQKPAFSAQFFKDGPGMPSASECRIGIYPVRISDECLDAFMEQHGNMISRAIGVSRGICGILICLQYGVLRDLVCRIGVSRGVL